MTFICNTQNKNQLRRKKPSNGLWQNVRKTRAMFYKRVNTETRLLKIIPQHVYIAQQPRLPCIVVINRNHVYRRKRTVNLNAWHLVQQGLRYNDSTGPFYIQRWLCNSFEIIVVTMPVYLNLYLYCISQYHKTFINVHILTWWYSWKQFRHALSHIPSTHSKRVFIS